MKKDPRVYLAHILECIERIQTYTKGGREVFLADRMIQDAVIRNLGIIGEASRLVSQEYWAAHPEIPWRGMLALRNVLIHDYEGVDINKVWSVVEQNLPALKTVLDKTLPPLAKLEQELAGDDEPKRSKWTK